MYVYIGHRTHSVAYDVPRTKPLLLLPAAFWLWRPPPMHCLLCVYVCGRVCVFM